MPQMSPLMWAVLFSMFTLILMFIIVKMYFFTSKSITNQSNTITENSLQKKINWKW